MYNSIWTDFMPCHLYIFIPMNKAHDFLNQFLTPGKMEDEHAFTTAMHFLSKAG